MNHGKNDTNRRGDGRFHKQKEVPSRTEQQARREREAAGDLQETFGHSHGQDVANDQSDARLKDAGKSDQRALSGTVAGDGNAGQARNARGIGSADSPRASAKNADVGAATHQGGARTGTDEEPYRDEPLPARLGDRDRREQQMSEPGAGYGDSEREQPHPGLRDVEGMVREADFSTRDEGGSRNHQDVARTGLDEQQERLGMSDSESQKRREKQASAGGYGYGGGRRDTPKGEVRHEQEDASGKGESHREK